MPEVVEVLEAMFLWLATLYMQTALFLVLGPAYGVFVVDLQLQAFLAEHCSTP